MQVFKLGGCVPPVRRKLRKGRQKKLISRKTVFTTALKMVTSRYTCLNTFYLGGKKKKREREREREREKYSSILSIEDIRNKIYSQTQMRVVCIQKVTFCWTFILDCF